MNVNEISVVQNQFNPVSLMPKTFNEKYQMAGVLSRSGLLPAGLNTPEKVCVALEWGHELQLSPMVAVQNIAVINGKPTLSADIMAAVVKRSPEYGGCEWKELTDKAAECVITRKGIGYEEKTTSRFTWQDAQNANLTNKDVWKKYPKRMLKHRCLSYALRDAFPDILAGLYSPEEMESVNDDSYTNVVCEKKNDNNENVIAGTVNVENVSDVEEGSIDNSNIAEAFKKLLEGYQNKLGEHFETAYAVLQTGTEEEMVSMYKRCVDYLVRKGVKVA